MSKKIDELIKTIPELSLTWQLSQAFRAINDHKKRVGIGVSNSVIYSEAGNSAWYVVGHIVARHYKDMELRVLSVY